MGAVEGGEVLGIGIIMECLQEVGKRPDDIERLNRVERGAAMDEEVALRRNDVISSWPGAEQLGRKEMSLIIVDAEHRWSSGQSSGLTEGEGGEFKRDGSWLKKLEKAEFSVLAFSRSVEAEEDELLRIGMEILSNSMHSGRDVCWCRQSLGKFLPVSPSISQFLHPTNPNPEEVSSSFSLHLPVSPSHQPQPR